MNLILPDHIARKKYQAVLLYWCGGAKEVPNGTQIARKPAPVPPHPPSLWFTCPDCGKEHMAAMVLMETTDDSQQPDGGPVLADNGSAGIRGGDLFGSEDGAERSGADLAGEQGN